VRERGGGRFGGCKEGEGGLGVGEEGRREGRGRGRGKDVGIGRGRGRGVGFVVVGTVGERIVALLGCWVGSVR